MKLVSFIICLSTFSISARAFIEEVPTDIIELNDHGVFIDCELENGQWLQATEDMVIVDNEILAKTDIQAYLTTTSEQIKYTDHSYEVIVYRQYCGREGLQGIIVKNRNTNLSTQLSCKSINFCKI